MSIFKILEVATIFSNGVSRNNQIQTCQRNYSGYTHNEWLRDDSFGEWQMATLLYIIL